MKKRSKKKSGLSTVIITLLVVLLSIVAIGIVWVVVKNVIEKNTELVSIQNQFFGENMDITSVKVYSSYVNISLRRPAGEIKSESINISGVTVSYVDVDIFSVVDLSGSMIECSNINRSCCTNLGGEFSSPSTCVALASSKQSGCLSCGGTWDDKLTPLQNANRNIINTLLGGSDNRMGLVAYRDVIVSSASTNLMKDIPSLNSTINLWTSVGNTCICCGINNASDRLMLQSTPDTPKAIIVMSDGQANVKCSRQGTNNETKDAIKAACDANSTLKNVAIWSIGVGNDVDVATLTSIAKCGGGKYYNVTNASELIQTYQSIAQEIETKYQSVEYLTYLSIVFYNATNSYKDVIGDIPDVLQTKTYNFNLQGSLSGKITRIEIYPVVLTKSKDEVTGPLLAFWQAN